jgi:hypothetical protein
MGPPTGRPRQMFNAPDQEITDNAPYANIVKAVVEIVQRANFLGPVESNNGFTVLGEPVGGSGGSAHVVQDEGTPLTQRANLNFVGAGVTATDDSPDTVVTIPGGMTALTGDVTASGTGSQAATVANNVVTNEKLADMAEARLKGRAAGAGTGDPTDLTGEQARVILNVADGANAYVHPNHSGDVTSVADGAQTIAANAVTTAKIADANVTNAKLANMAELTLKGRVSSGTGVPEDVTPLQLRSYTCRRTTEVSNATPSINCDNVDRHTITALSAAITSLTITGTPYDTQTLWIAIRDDGTSRAIDFGATVEESLVTMPTATEISKRLNLLLSWHAATTKWQLVAKA